MQEAVSNFLSDQQIGGEDLAHQVAENTRLCGRVEAMELCEMASRFDLDPKMVAGLISLRLERVAYPSSSLWWSFPIRVSPKITFVGTNVKCDVKKRPFVALEDTYGRIRSVFSLKLGERVHQLAIIEMWKDVEKASNIGFQFGTAHLENSFTFCIFGVEEILGVVFVVGDCTHQNRAFVEIGEAPKIDEKETFKKCVRRMDETNQIGEDWLSNGGGKRKSCEK